MAIRRGKRGASIFLDIGGMSFQNDNKKIFVDFIKENYSHDYLKFNSNDTLKLDVIFHFKQKCPYDIDNMLKSLLDSLQGIVYKNDNKIKELSAKITEYSYIEGISVFVRKL